MDFWPNAKRPDGVFFFSAAVVCFCGVALESAIWANQKVNMQKSCPYLGILLVFWD